MRACNAAAKNTDALKRLNKEKAEELRLELETQRAKAEANMSKYIAEEARLKEKVNALTRERSDLVDTTYFLKGTGGAS